VGADTVHLCMQDYLWDGIKRDRLVWIGDMHPEVSTINAVFGFTTTWCPRRSTSPATSRP
jgi:alpha-L-rhamnosidase